MLDFISVGGVIGALTNILCVQSFTGFSLMINYSKTTWEHILEETRLPRCPICTTWLDAGCFTIFFKISLFWLQLNAQTCIQHSGNTPRNSVNCCWPLLLCFCHATQHFCFLLCPKDKPMRSAGLCFQWSCKTWWEQAPRPVSGKTEWN